MGLKTGIWASRLEFGPRDFDFGLETRIWASGLGFEGGTKEEKKKKEEEEKIPHMCESIGHRPLLSRCPKCKKYFHFCSINAQKLFYYLILIRIRIWIAVNPVLFIT